MLFAFQFIIFWWELARWLDSWLLSVLYDSSAHNSWNMHFMENTENDVIVNMVMGSLFIVIPGIWLASMSWAGMRLGSIASSFVAGSKDAHSTGGKFGGTVSNATTK
ncbi:conjugal transfer protein TraG N-terminal domain-containing protein [Chelonobacter oris]|uniref:conjugal transfer protein TraG N-terminal domain-containing protein n=1 Tax=Chelonobacter oris TaxID=505317 RepID=UPI003CC57D62